MFKHAADAILPKVRGDVCRSGPIEETLEFGTEVAMQISNAPEEGVVASLATKFPGVVSVHCEGQMRVIPIVRERRAVWIDGGRHDLVPLAIRRDKYHTIRAHTA